METRWQCNILGLAWLGICIIVWSLRCWAWKRIFWLGRLWSLLLKSFCLYVFGILMKGQNVRQHLFLGRRWPDQCCLWYMYVLDCSCRSECIYIYWCWVEAAILFNFDMAVSTQPKHIIPRQLLHSRVLTVSHPNARATKVTSAKGAFHGNIIIIIHIFEAFSTTPCALVSIIIIVNMCPIWWRCRRVLFVLIGAVVMDAILVRPSCQILITFFLSFGIHDPRSASPRCLCY